MNNIDTEKSLIIFTDGSSLGNPGPGGWGAVLIQKQIGEVVELGGSKEKTTNNEMELAAILSALTYAMNNSNIIHLFTDSQYAINGITSWIYGWKKNGWKTKNGDDVKNAFYFKNIDLLLEERGRDKVHFHHVAGHVGIPGNERVDDIARELAEGKNVELFRGKFEDYTISNILSLNFELSEKKKKDTKGKKAYSYLSLIDGILEIHNTWAECEARVKGQKAKFKKAISKEHEQEILSEWGIKKAA